MGYTTYQKIEDDVTLRDLLTTIPKVDANGITIEPPTVDTDRIDRIIETVSDSIDGMIGQRYVVPLTTASSINAVEWIARALSICMIFRPETGGPEWRQAKCMEAKEELTKMSTGEIDIPGATILSSKSAHLCNPYDDKYKELERPFDWPEQSWAGNDTDSSFLRGD
jgi:hypothetical protein